MAYPKGVELIAGPQLRAGSPLNPWPWFDRNAAASGLTVGRNFPAKSPKAALTGTASVATGSRTVTVTGGQLAAELSDSNRLYIRRADPSNPSATWWGDPLEITSIDYANNRIVIESTWSEPAVAGVPFSSDRTTRFSDSDSSLMGGYWNYYDQAQVQYINYYRTGDPEFLALARKVADVWWLQLGAGAGDITSVAPPRMASLGGLMLRAMDGRPEMWDWIERYTRHHFDNWVMARKGYPSLYFGVRDGSYCLLYAAWLSQVLPDSYPATSGGAVTTGAAKRAAYLRDAVDASVNYYARLQYADGSWRWLDDWDFSGDGGNPATDGYAQLSFHVGLLLHALVDVHRIVKTKPEHTAAAAKIAAAIKKSCDSLWSMYISAPVAGYHAPLRWRSLQYQLYSKGQPAVVAPTYTGDTNMIREYRQNASTIPHAFGYAYHLTGDPVYRERGDELMAAAFGNGEGPGADASRNLSDFTAPGGGRRAKEYNESYRASGRYLAYRLLAPGQTLPLANSASPATPTSTSNPSGPVTSASLDLVSLALTSSRDIASASTLSEAQVNALVGQIDEILESFKRDGGNFVAPDNILAELQAARSHALGALAIVKTGSEFMQDAKIRASWAGARLKRAKDRMILKNTP